MKQFCPNCEKDTECEHTAELYECNECGEDFAKYIVSRKPANSDVSTTQDVSTGLLEQIKYSKSLEEVNKKLRLELHTLRFKEAEDQRFIWWIWNVYAKNVNDLILSIISATTYDNETMAKLGKYGLPMKCFEILERVKEGTDIIYGSDRIYDGTYLNVEISADAKNGITENKPEPSNFDVSVTQDVITDVKTPNSIENTNPDYYKDELYLDEDFRMLAKTYPADVSAIGVTTLIDYVEALEAELARRDEELKTTDGLLKEATETIGAVIACCTYNSNDDAKIGIYGIDQKAFTKIDQFITHYNDAVSAGKVSVNVKPVKRENDYQNDNRTNTGG